MSLGDVANITLGGTPSTLVPGYWNGQIPWMASGEVHRRNVFEVDGRITELGLASSNAVLVSPPAVAIALAGQGKTRGTVALVHIELCTNQSIALIKGATGALDTGYLFHDLSARYEEMRARSSGGGRGGLSRTVLRAVPISLPPIAEQLTIAEIFDSLDLAIQKTEQIVEKLKLAKQGLLHDLLTRGIDDNGELGAAHTTEAEQIHRWPDHWARCNLQSCLSGIDAGWSPNCPETPPAEGEWGVLKVSAVTSGEFRHAESKTLPKDLRPMPELEVRQEDVIMARANGVASLVGVSAFVRHVRPRLMLSDKTLRLRPNRTRVVPRFLALVLQSDHVRAQIMSRLSGSSGQRNISQRYIKELRVSMPSVEEQMRICMRVDALQERLDAEVSSYSKLRLVKVALMDDLLTGRVRVTPLLEKDSTP